MTAIQPSRIIALDDVPFYREAGKEIRARIRQRRFYQRRLRTSWMRVRNSLQPWSDGWSLTLATRHALEALIIGLHFHPFVLCVYIYTHFPFLSRQFFQQEKQDHPEGRGEKREEGCLATT